MNSVIPFAIGFICGLICMALILRREENRWLKRMYRKGKIMRTMEIEMLAERKPDAKAYERFKRKPYTTSGGVAIGQKRPD